MPSDVELVDQILAGQHQQYAVLVHRYERLVCATAMRSVQDSHRADDVAQEAFVAAFQNLSSLRDRSNFGAWLLGIVRRKAAQAARQDRRSRTSSGDFFQEDKCASDSGHLSQESLELLELVERLPDQERIVVGLRHFEGHSMQEIANFTGRPVGTVTKQLSRAHARLHVWITQEKPNERYETSYR